ncbi:sialic acid-binding Ig-like lectin 6 [Poecilia reticulata]|uniref:sialic acid-binding Ig-like lectin 6 n=1 Tax=Poecilia reticulata TaxID=8081 RepID=UPI0004A37084|nr:PREDICTED: sialic acid-binding Ig-like lectin 6 [Poecilia reticulata]XP_008409242.1 PREDICTED: sialic acid-binding Ig-like lectin 6 [Poecilia reticulata]
MALTFLAILWIFLRTTSCQFQCIPETLDDSDFSINVTEHITVRSTDCIRIPHEVTFPQDKVTVPYKKMLFKGDPSNVVDTKVVSNMNRDAKDPFSITTLPPGEYKYGVKLEWGCNQTYVFPKRIHISISALTTPTVVFRPMVEGQRTQLTCLAPMPCSGEVFLFWKWTNADGQSRRKDNNFDDYDYMRWQMRFGPRRRQNNKFILVYPTADDHNTNITCTATYGHGVAETTVTLTVKFSPRILNSSHCTVKGELLVCVCTSWGNPLSPVVWPLETLTDHSVTSFSDAQRVSSTLTMPAAKYHNATVKCMSRNELGQAESEIPIQNSTEPARVNSFPESSEGCHSALPWLTGVCFALNLVFVAVFICIYQRSRKQQKESREEADTYATLRKADMEEAYSTISPQNR